MHYVLMVTVDGSVKEDGIDKALANLMNPFSEMLEMEPYEIDPAIHKYHDTWQDTLAKAKKWYAENPDDELDTANFTDLDWIKEYTGEDWRENGDGGYVEMSTWNPNAKWDWWVIGGRWENFLNRVPNGHETDPVWGKYPIYKDGKNILRRRDLRAPQSTYAYLTKEGQWVEKPEIDWQLPNEERDAQIEERDRIWDKEFAEYLLTVPGDDWLVILDIHS